MKTVYTYWPVDSKPGDLSPTHTFATREDAEEARSAHVAMNPSESLNINEYAILSREVSPWEVTEFVERRSVGGPDRGDLFYAAIANQFLTLVADGDRSPIRTLARRHIHSENTVKSWIAQARKRDLLNSLGRGRKGGSLTPKATELLSRDGTSK